MNNNLENLQVIEIDDISHSTEAIDLLVLAAGFEDRALHLLKEAKISNHAHCLLIKYDDDTENGDEVFNEYYEILDEKFSHQKIKTVTVHPERIDEFTSSLEEELSSFPSELKTIGIDVSGMTSYAICICLKFTRKIRPFEKQTIFYTSAAEYVPSRDDYKLLLEKQTIEDQPNNEIDYLPKSMALEMSKNLVIDAFQGHSSGNTRTCLAIFAGYEVHRSSGTIDAINPSLLLLMYGIPGEDKFSWRLDLSKQLHAKFETGRRCASEELSTLNIQESLDILENYYSFLIDDYDLVIAPICSKMHSVSAYLFWERYGEVQLSFPLPIGYNPKNRPTGVGKTYKLNLYEQRMLFRKATETRD